MDKLKFLTVSQLNEYIKMLIDSNPILLNVTVRGEISNFTNHYRTGHLYFTLKDEDGLIRAVMFKTNASKLKFMPENGMKVFVHGRVSAYVRDGQYQIYVDDIQPDGAGELYVAFEQQKKRLEAEGLFSSDLKKKLPFAPESIGIITSPTGAAIHDMINILGRRFPLAQIILYPAVVQGSTAPASLISGIEFFNSQKNVDVVIIGRGGGSLEDLWAFNDESLVRKVACSKIPVISAVGHESDFTLCDFSSDCRAPTPSAAAELAVPNSEELYEKLISYRERLRNLISRKTDALRKELKYLAQTKVLSLPSAVIDEKRMHLDSVLQQLDRISDSAVKERRAEFLQSAARLEMLNPLGILSRGYSIVSDDKTGKSTSKISELRVGQTVNIRMDGGSAKAMISELSLSRDTDV